MKLGFDSPIPPKFDPVRLLAFAAAGRFACAEGMCWPHRKVEGKIAAETHLDVATSTTVSSFTHPLGNVSRPFFS